MDAGGMNPSESYTMNRKIAAKIESETFNLPEEITVEILSRLPVKSLIKFRCVSKSWRSVISSPSFAQFHLETSLNSSSSFTNHCLMQYDVCPNGPTHGLHQLSLRSVMEKEISLIDDDDDDAVNIIDFPWTQSRRAYVYGSHNGLLCISPPGEEAEGLLLWNPSTKVHFNLPTADVHPLPGLNILGEMIGFGYSNSTQDYKVLIIFCMFTTLDGAYESVVKIYSQKANSWKTMEPYNYNHMAPCMGTQSGKLVNGKLHFIMAPAFSREHGEIVYIDLDSETDGIVQLPDYGNGSFVPKVFSLDVGVLGGCLCVLNKDYDRSIHNMDLWVLKEYGVKESWTKLVTVLCVGEVGQIWYWDPLLMLPTGNILFVCERGSAAYNPRRKTWRFPKIRSYGSRRDVFIHVESLVWPLPNAE